MEAPHTSSSRHLSRGEELDPAESDGKEGYPARRNWECLGEEGPVVWSELGCSRGEELGVVPIAARLDGGFRAGMGTLFLGFGVFGCPLFLYMIGVCSWNVRGLNCLTKRNAVRAVLSKQCNKVVCLQESKVSFVSNSFLRSIGGSFLNKCVYLESVGTSGGSSHAGTQMYTSVSTSL